LTPDQAQNLIEEVRKVAREYGAWCQVTTNEKPDLETVRIEINAKVKTMTAADVIAACSKSNKV